MLTLALGMIANGLSTASVVADDNSVQAHATGHDHDAMTVEKKVANAFASLSPRDRKQAEAQRFCPIMEYSRLGVMDAPIKVMVKGKPVFVCCKGCVDDAKDGGEATLKTVQKLTDASATLAKLPAKERAAAEAQKYCAVANKNLLGSMGAPVKLQMSGKPVYLCCNGCEAKAQANPTATLAKVEALRMAGMKGGHDHAAHKHDDGHGVHKH